MAEDAVISVYFLIYTRTPVTGLFESWLLWIHVSLTCEITLRRTIYQYRRSARQKNIIHIDNTETTVQNGSVPCNAAAGSRWVCLTILAKFTRAASSKSPLLVKARRVFSYFKLSIIPSILYYSTLYISVYCVCKYMSLGNSGKRVVRLNTNSLCIPKFVVLRYVVAAYTPTYGHAVWRCP